MARVIIIPGASDSRNQVKLLIALARSTGAAVIMSQCLHTRKEITGGRTSEDGTEEEAVVRCVDCGAAGAEEPPEDEGFRHGPALSEVNLGTPKIGGEDFDRELRGLPPLAE